MNKIITYSLFLLGLLFTTSLSAQVFNAKDIEATISTLLPFVKFNRGAKRTIEGFSIYSGRTLNVKFDRKE